jgi:hypothetical protein
MSVPKVFCAVFQIPNPTQLVPVNESLLLKPGLVS